MQQTRISIDLLEGVVYYFIQGVEKRNLVSQSSVL